ncbi:hypothetical protein BFW01_g9984 [Lasiodiplodia theobromae]|uniref:uncharacterized protein n=1 Tax=Lasiodiplodia theobromae TaxID=45133 RepID=UPI0015C2D157|nr:uncharacterized protein LTHEOB_5181 [Lasiodiplodia theobromae]KAF4545348.1 hypothetical protein LTHEOB_5181 [Lasiodiplodia theobromae]KAF9639087.1 hypothetical protein BFW01_g9984 [Lasiodiplodia theobromae]
MSLIRSLCFLSFSLEVLGATCFTSQERLPGDPCGTDIAAALTSEDRVGCFCAGNWDAGDYQQLERSTNHGSVVYSIERTDNTVPLKYCEEAFNNIIDECILDGNTWGGVFSFDGEVYNISNTVYPDNPLLPTDQGGPIGPLKREPQTFSILPISTHTETTTSCTETTTITTELTTESTITGTITETSPGTSTEISTETFTSTSTSVSTYVHNDGSGANYRYIHDDQCIDSYGHVDRDGHRADYDYLGDYRCIDRDRH